MKTFKGIDLVTSVFSGQSDIVVGKLDADYSTATLDDLFSVEDAVSLGQIVEDSTSWDGDEPEMTPIKDEQGDTITTQVTAGTLAFSCEIASTSQAMVENFLKGKIIGADALTGLFAGAKATAFGIDLPVVTRPIMVANDEGNKALVFPKAKIVGNLSYSDKLWRIAISVTAEYIETYSDDAKTKLVLGTGMLLEDIKDTTASA